MEEIDMLTAFKKYAVFSGRARRKEYWLFMLFSVLLHIAAGIIDSFGNSAEDGTGLMESLVILVLFIPALAVTFRRLHDIGKSGWWLLLWFVPFIGAIVLFIFTLQDSQPGDNQYGPYPKAEL